MSAGSLSVEARSSAGRIPVSAEPEQLILATREDVLAALAHVSGRLGRRDAMSSVSVRLPGMSPGDSLKAQLRLNESAVHCGCAMGSAFMASSAVLCVGYLWVTSGSPLGTDFFELLSAGLVVFAAGAIGKLLGIIRARRRLIRELRTLAAIAEPSVEQGG